MNIKNGLLTKVTNSDIKDGIFNAWDGVTKIGCHAFNGCTGLTSIIIPDSVMEIGEGAFDGCTGLTSIIIPDSVREIGDWAFDECTGLTSIIWQNKEYRVECIDGYCMEVLSAKTKDDYLIKHCRYFGRKEESYIARKDGLSAHGNTIKEAINDLHFKIMQQTDVSEHVDRVKKQGYVTAEDYRLITGACRQGTQMFMNEHNISWDDKLPISDVCNLVKGAWGADTFLKYFRKNAI